MPDEGASSDRAGRYWDAYVRGADHDAVDLDPALARTIDRLHNLVPDPEATTKARVWQAVLANAKASQPSSNGVIPKQVPPGAQVWSRFIPGSAVTPPRGRRPWWVAQLATAALLLVALVGIVVAFGPGRFDRQAPPPAFLHAIEATPAAATPVAEFVWQSEGNPDLPLADPTNLAIDRQGNIWVTDGRNSQFQIFAPDGTFLEAWGTPGEGEGELDFVEPTLFGGYGAGSLAFDAAGNLYVADPGNYRIQKFGPDRSFLAAWGTYGLGDGQFAAILNLAIDGQGRVYVTDEARGDVQLFDADGAFLSVWSNGAEGWLGKPSVIEIDGDGNLWFTHFQKHAIQKYSPDGRLLASWDVSGFKVGQLYQPSGLAIDAQRRVFVSEWGNNRIQVFDGDGTVVAVLGRTGVIEDRLMGPNGLVLDGLGNLYVTEDGSDRIQKLRLLPPLAPG